MARNLLCDSPFEAHCKDGLGGQGATIPIEGSAVAQTALAIDGALASSQVQDLYRPV